MGFSSGILGESLTKEEFKVNEMVDRN